MSATATKTKKKTGKAKGAKVAGGKLSCLDTAAKVLGEMKEPMTTK